MYELNPIGIFHEKEGVTFILEQQDAVNKKIHYQSVYRLITLNVHSSLDAVGLTAAFSAKLAEKNISANVVAAYYHDHIFVPEEKAEQALNAILELQKGTQRDVSTFYFIYSINRKMIRPVCGPFTHLGCEEGPHRSVEFTLLRTGGITSKTEIPLSGSV